MAGLDQQLSQIVSENEDRLRTRCDEATEDVRAGRNVETDQEINLYLKVIKTLAFRVKKSETVKNLKAMLHEHEGIPDVLQQLFFDGQLLGDEHKIMDCGIADNSTLHAFVYNSATINLHIKIPSKQTTIAVDAKFDDTIQCVKSIIEAKEGIQANDYSLHHDGNILEDSMSLASLNFQGEPTLHLVSNPKDVLPIFIKTPYGKLLKLQVKLLYTIGDVKNLIESNMPVGNWDLVHEEAQLEGRRTLAYYELKENVILEMQPAAYQIFVKIRTGKTISLEVNHLTTIAQVKNLIESDMPVGNWDLVHEEARLEGWRTLAYYELKENVIVEMQPAAYQIFVKVRTGKTISLEVNHLTTIAHVKNLIESDMPVGNWDLVQEEARLEGWRTLAYYELKENVILEMQPATYQIFVKIWTRKSVSLEVNHLTTIADVKHKVFLRTGMPADRVWLGFAGKVLKDHKHLVSYNILKDSTLDAHCR